jgi:hypothetical protein
LGCHIYGKLNLSDPRNLIFWVIKLLAGFFVNSLIKEYLLKGKAQHSWPSCTNWFRSAAFDNANIIYFLTKTRYLDEEVKRTEPSLKLGFPAPA